VSQALTRVCDPIRVVRIHLRLRLLLDVSQERERLESGTRDVHARRLDQWEDGDSFEGYVHPYLADIHDRYLEEIYKFGLHRRVRLRPIESVLGG